MGLFYEPEAPRIVVLLCQIVIPIIAFDSNRLLHYLTPQLRILVLHLQLFAPHFFALNLFALVEVHSDVKLVPLVKEIIEEIVFIESVIVAELAGVFNDCSLFYLFLEPILIHFQIGSPSVKFLLLEQLLVSHFVGI